MNSYPCSKTELRAAPIRLPMRLYMLIGGVSPSEALNCGFGQTSPAKLKIAQELKTAMNRWKANGLSEESGKVDYQRLAGSKEIEAYLPLAAALRGFDPTALESEAERKAFWINIYNALLIHGIIAYGARTSLWNIRGAFERIAYNVGGYRYSLDDIEHGILRGNKAHFLIGGARFSQADPRRRHVLGSIDPRLHFALVCGASSCPPIGIYQPENLDAQLELAARNFVNGGGVVVNRAARTVALSRIFQWYSPDFGGKWMGTGRRKRVLNYVAEFLEDGAERAFIRRRLDEIRVTYQRYDRALNV